MGALGKLINYFDTTPVMAQIDAGKYDQARATIESMYSTNVYDLDIRVTNMAKALNGASDTMQKAMHAGRATGRRQDDEGRASGPAPSSSPHRPLAGPALRAAAAPATRRCG